LLHISINLQQISKIINQLKLYLPKIASSNQWFVSFFLSFKLIDSSKLKDENIQRDGEERLIFLHIEAERAEIEGELDLSLECGQEKKK
jgi:hypothetical protein